MNVKTMAAMAASGESPEVLFWVGCAGSFDQRAQKVTRAFAQILDAAGISFPDDGFSEYYHPEWLWHKKNCNYLPALL
jgi:hypothetical protein